MNPPFIVVSSTTWITKDARKAHRRTSRLMVQLPGSWRPQDTVRTWRSWSGQPAQLVRVGYEVDFHDPTVDHREGREDRARRVVEDQPRSAVDRHRLDPGSDTSPEVLHLSGHRLR